MLFADISFSTEAILAISTLLGALAGAVTYIFRLLMTAKDDQIALALEMSKKKSVEQMLEEALVIIETRVAGRLASAGKPAVAPVAPVVPESSSPATPEQKAVAEVATLRARLTAAALAVGAPPRETVPEQSPTGRTPAGVVLEQLREEVAEVPEKTAEIIKEDAKQSPGGKP